MYQILFSSREAALQKYRYLLKDKEFGEHLVAIAVDESHCVKKWYVVRCSNLQKLDIFFSLIMETYL